MRNLTTHRLAYLRSLDAVNAQLAQATSVVRVPAFTPGELAWFARPLVSLVSR